MSYAGRWQMEPESRRALPLAALAFCAIDLFGRICASWA